MIQVKDITAQQTNWHADGLKIKATDSSDNIFSQIFDTTKARFTETSRIEPLRSRSRRQDHLDTVNGEARSTADIKNEDQLSGVEGYSAPPQREQDDPTPRQPAQNESTAGSLQTSETETAANNNAPTEPAPTASETQTQNATSSAAASVSETTGVVSIASTTFSTSALQILMNLLADQPNAQVILKQIAEARSQNSLPQETGPATTLPANGKNVSPQLQAQLHADNKIPVPSAPNVTTKALLDDFISAIKVVTEDTKTSTDPYAQTQPNVSTDSGKITQMEMLVTINNPEPQKTPPPTQNHHPALIKPTSDNQNHQEENPPPQHEPNASFSDDDKNNFQNPTISKPTPTPSKSYQPAPAHVPLSPNASSSSEHNGKNPSQPEAAVLDQIRSVPTEKTTAPNNVPQLLGLEKSDADNPTEIQENIDQIVKAARAAVQQHSSRIQIRLEPPEMGLLRIEIKQNASGLQLQLQAANSKAHQLLQQNASELHKALESSGVHARQIDIQLRMDLRSSHNPDTQQDTADRQTSGQPGQEFPQQEYPQHEQQSHDYYDIATSSDSTELNSEGQTEADLENNSAANDATPSKPSTWRQMEFATVDLKI